MRPTFRSLAPLVVGLVLLGACGGSDGDGSATSSTAAVSTSASLAPSTTVAVSVTNDVTYTTDGGEAETLDVYLPAGDATDRAAVVLVHGGGWNQGSAADLAPDAQAFAAAGLVSFDIDYRLDQDGTGAGWPGELDDVLAALRWVADHADEYGVDPERIGVYGSSAGGNLAMLAATRRDGVDGPSPKAVVSWSGVTDLTTLTPPDLAPGASTTTDGAADVPSGCAGDPICLGVVDPAAITEFLGCSLDDCPDTYADASPVTHVTGASPPMYLVSFEEDLVPLAQQQEMVSKLEAAGVDHDLLVLPGEGHAESARPQALAPSIAWFQARL